MTTTSATTALLPKKALLIGCNYAGTPNQLYGCINDIVNMSHILTDALDYDLKNIYELRDDNVRMLPTRANILSALNYLVKQSANLSEIWVHYSGHGSQVRDAGNDEKDGFDEIIVPVDYRNSGFITDDELFQLIKNVKCRMIMIFDSCGSGSICDLKNMFEFDGKKLIRTVDGSKIVDNPNVFVYSGCKDNQSSIDTYNSNQAQGVGAFTDSLLHSFRINHCNADVLKLYMDTCEYIKSRGYSQTPVFTASSDKPAHIIARPSQTIQTPVKPIEIIVQTPAPAAPAAVPVATPVPTAAPVAAAPTKTLKVLISNPFQAAFHVPNSMQSIPSIMSLGTTQANKQKSWGIIETTLNK